MMVGRKTSRMLASAFVLALAALLSPSSTTTAVVRAASIYQRTSSTTPNLVVLERRQSTTSSSSAADIGALPEDVINLVKQRCEESSKGSWENGTRAQALLEHDYPMLSVFYNPTIPISPLAGIPTEVNAIAQYTIANKPNGTLMFCQDGSAADPASLGISVLLANVTIDNVDYMHAVNEENAWLTTHAPRTQDGAISHRVSEVQLWSDFMSMVPPYLAYYGALLGNESYIQAAYDQCRMYRQYMTPSGNGGVWRHILLGSQDMQDPGFWSTGNAWAAYGMLRVLVTMMHTSSYSASDIMTSQKTDLKNWILEILNGSWRNLNSSTNLLPNYLDEANTFPDASSTALLAAVSYRLAQLGLDNSTIGYANSARQAVFAGVDRTTGWLGPVVNPYDWAQPGANSSEAQAFVLMLSAAHRDYVNVTGDTTSGGPSPTNPSGGGTNGGGDGNGNGNGGNQSPQGSASGRAGLVDMARNLIPAMLGLLTVAWHTL